MKQNASGKKNLLDFLEHRFHSVGAVVKIFNFGTVYFTDQTDEKILGGA